MGILGAAAQRVPAATLYWVGGNSEDPTSWVVAANWNTNVVPANNSNDLATFRDSSPTPLNKTPTLTASRTVGGLNFNNSVGWSINGAVTLTTEWQGVTSTGVGTNTINTTQVNINGNGAWNIGPNNVLIVNSALNFGQNSSQTNKTGEGTLRLKGSVNTPTNTRPFTIKAGVVEMEATSQNLRYVYVTGSTAILRSNLDDQYGGSVGHYIAVDNSGTFDLNSKTETIAALYVGSATGLTVAGGANPNTAIGGLGGGSVTLGTGLLTATTVRLKGGSISSTGAGKLTATNVTTEAWNTSSIVSGQLALTTGDFIIADGAALIDLDVTGQISGTAGLNKTGAGVLRITGNNTYAGNTSITEGTLLVTNSTGSATGTSTVSVTGAGKLGGGGIISEAVTIGSGATLAAGNSVGTLTVGGLTLNSGSLSIVEFNGSANDLVSVIGSNGLTINGGALTLLAEGTSDPAVFTANGTYHLFQYVGALGGAFTNLSVANPQGGVSYSFGTSTVSGQKYVDLIVSVPEPTAAVGLAVMSSIFCLRRSRRS